MAGTASNTLASNTLVGIAGSHGIAIAPAVVIDRGRQRYLRRHIEAAEVEEEVTRFVTAVAEVQGDLRSLAGPMSERPGEMHILEAYVMMVGDELLATRVGEQIRGDKRCAEWAVASAIGHLAKQLSEMNDGYLRERSHDIEFVGERLLRALSSDDAVAERPAIEGTSIVVAHDLSPADTASMLRQPVIGFVTQMGSRTSHTSIMARALEIPAVVGVDSALERIGSGDILVVDGLRGTVTINPTEEQLEEANRRMVRFRTLTNELALARDRPTCTQDGTRVALRANIELPDEAAVAYSYGAEGIGLYRTEFLYTGQLVKPSELSQLETFSRAVRSMSGQPVTLRTFDLGGDKFASTFTVPEEMNPMLGLRAVRLAMSEPDVFMEHLRAMVRASAFGEVRIMVPLVSSVSELRIVRSMLKRAREQVAESGGRMAENIPLGAMVEVPAAAVMADRFAQEADFLSIGTNDLVQYALAIDRTNRMLAHLASPFDPSILRLVRNVIEAGRDYDCPVSLCGEMASEPYGALLLVGLGLRDLSMESVAIPEIKEALHRVPLAELEELARTALNMATAVEVEDLLEDTLEPRLHDLLTMQPESSPRSSRRSSRPSRPAS